MKLSLRAKNYNKIKEKCALMRKAKERKRIDQPREPLSYSTETIDPLYTLTFTDHLINKTWVFTLHNGRQCNSFRIDVNGQHFRDGGWSTVLAEIRKKRVRIQSMRHEK